MGSSESDVGCDESNNFIDGDVRGNEGDIIDGDGWRNRMVRTFAKVISSKA